MKSLVIISFVFSSMLFSLENFFDPGKTGFVVESYPWCDELYVHIQTKKGRDIVDVTFSIHILFGDEFITKTNFSVSPGSFQDGVFKKKILLNEQGEEIFPGFYTLQIYHDTLLFAKKQFIGSLEKSSAFLGKLINDFYINTMDSFHQTFKQILEQKKISQKNIKNWRLFQDQKKEEIYVLMQKLQKYKGKFYFLPMVDTYKSIENVRTYCLVTLRKYDLQISKRQTKNPTNDENDYRQKIEINELLSKKAKDSLLKNISDLYENFPKNEEKEYVQLRDVLQRASNNLHQFQWSFE